MYKSIILFSCARTVKERDVIIYVTLYSHVKIKSIDSTFTVQFQ